MIFLLLFIYLTFTNISCLFLTTHQRILIENIIKNPSTTQLQREKVNKILYFSYENMAVKKAYEFKNLHKFKCNSINTEELIMASKIGLFKSLRNYKGTSNFANYSNIYIRGELLHLLTQSYSLSVLPKSYRKMNKGNFTKEQLTRYKKLLTTKTIHLDDIWLFDKVYQKNNDKNSMENIIEKETLHYLWKKINTELNPSLQKIFSLKYDFHFKKINSNKKISELYGCSEENIRLKLKKIKKIVKEKILNENIIKETANI